MAATILRGGPAILCLPFLSLTACEGAIAPTATEVLQPDIAPVVVGTHPPCPTDRRIDFVADDINSLHLAHTTAPPGSVIGIRGMIEITADIDVAIEGLTFTCVESGAGIRAEPGIGVGALFQVYSADVTIQHLILDAREAIGGAVLTWNDGESTFADRTRFVSNTVLCGPSDCAFFQSATHAFAEGFVVTDNELLGAGTGSGIHIQGARNVRVSGNVVRASDPSGSGILVNGVEQIEISGNEVSGPWGESLVLIDGVFAVAITANRISGAQVRAVRMEAMNGVAIRRNEVDCGPSSCVLFFNPEHVSVTENRFRSAGSLSGLHFTGFIAHVDISRNELLATAPATSPFFGAIRIRDTSGARVLENVIEGPWANGLVLGLVNESAVAANRVEGAMRTAISLSGNSNTLTGNRTETEGTAIVLSAGCDNVMRGNTGSGAQGTLLLMDPTGGNTAYLTGASSDWVDEGTFDCDGDGVVDPNTVVAPPHLP